MSNKRKTSAISDKSTVRLKTFELYDWKAKGGCSKNMTKVTLTNLTRLTCRIVKYETGLRRGERKDRMSRGLTDMSWMCGDEVVIVRDIILYPLTHSLGCPGCLQNN